MPNINILNMQGGNCGTMELSETVFGAEVNVAVLHSVVRAYLLNQRQGTQSTLTRSEVSGGGRKPWRQKGTGRARQGSTRAAQWIKGGIIFGPDKVMIVVGANKVVDDLPAAFDRIKQIAPANAKRIGHRTPCAVTGKCEMCEIQQSVCNATSIIHNGRKHPGRFNVIVIAEDVGF